MEPDVTNVGRYPGSLLSRGRLWPTYGCQTLGRFFFFFWWTENHLELATLFFLASAISPDLADLHHSSWVIRFRLLLRHNISVIREVSGARVEEGMWKQLSLWLTLSVINWEMHWLFIVDINGPFPLPVSSAVYTILHTGRGLHGPFNTVKTSHPVYTVKNISLFQLPCSHYNTKPSCQT